MLVAYCLADCSWQAPQLTGLGATLSSGGLAGISEWQLAQVLVLWTVLANNASSMNREISFPAELVLLSVLSAWQSRQAALGFFSAAWRENGVRPSTAPRQQIRIAKLAPWQLAMIGREGCEVLVACRGLLRVMDMRSKAPASRTHSLGFAG